MNLFFDAVVTICAVVGAVLGVWNLLKARTPLYDAEVAHLDGAMFRLRNTGKRRIVTTAVMIDSGGTDLPETVLLNRGDAIDFRVDLWANDRRDPTRMDMWMSNESGPKRRRHIHLWTEVPYSPEVQKAQVWWLPPRKPDGAN